MALCSEILNCIYIGTTSQIFFGPIVGYGHNLVNSSTNHVLFMGTSCEGLLSLKQKFSSTSQKKVNVFSALIVI